MTATIPALMSPSASAIPACRTPPGTAAPRGQAPGSRTRQSCPGAPPSRGLQWSGQARRTSEPGQCFSVRRRLPQPRNWHAWHTHAQLNVRHTWLVHCDPLPACMNGIQSLPCLFSLTLLRHQLEVGVGALLRARVVHLPRGQGTESGRASWLKRSVAMKCCPPVRATVRPAPSKDRQGSAGQAQRQHMACAPCSTGWRRGPGWPQQSAAGQGGDRKGAT